MTDKGLEIHVSSHKPCTRLKMDNTSAEPDSNEEFTLTVDDRGRVALPKEVRDQLGIDPPDEISATLVGSVLELNPKPSTKLETATAGRDEWEHTTPTDAGEALFGEIDE